MAAKVNFDHANKLIVVTEVPDSSGQIDIDVEIDVYSDGKEDWRTDATLNKFKFPVRAVGGDDLPGEKELGSTFFLRYGWRIRPYEDDHVLAVNGNIYTEEGESPFVQTIGSYNVMVINTVSNLVDSTVQQRMAFPRSNQYGGPSHFLEAAQGGDPNVSSPADHGSKNPFANSAKYSLSFLAL